MGQEHSANLRMSLSKGERHHKSVRSVPKKFGWTYPLIHREWLFLGIMMLRLLIWISKVLCFSCINLSLNFTYSSAVGAQAPPSYFFLVMTRWKNIRFSGLNIITILKCLGTHNLRSLQADICPACVMKGVNIYMVYSQQNCSTWVRTRVHFGTCRHTHEFCTHSALPKFMNSYS